MSILTCGRRCARMAAGLALLTLFPLIGQQTIANVIAVAGDSSRAPVSQDFPQLRAKAIDGTGNGIAGVPVTFTVISGWVGGYFQGGVGTITVSTDSQGVAAASTFTANSIPGATQVRASAGGYSAIFHLTNLPPASVTLTAVAGTPQTVGPDFGMLCERFAVRATDADGHGLYGLTVTFTALPYGGSPSGSFLGYSSGQPATVYTDQNGIARASDFTAAPLVRGPIAVQASAEAGGVVSSVFFQVTVLNQPTTTSPLSATQLSVPINGMFQLGVQTQPHACVVFSDSASPLGAAASAPPNPLNGTWLTSPYAIADSTGIARSPTFTANGIPGAHTMYASSTQFRVTNLAPGGGSIGKITASGWVAQTGVLQRQFPHQLSATVVDINGNALAGYPVTFTAPVMGPAGLFQGGVSSITLYSDAIGGVTASPLTANNIAGPFQVTANAGGLTATYRLTNAVTAPASLTVVSGSPQTIPVDFPASASPMVVRVSDGQGNPVAAAPVTFTIPNYSPGVGFGVFAGGLGVGTALTDAMGIATAPAFKRSSVSGRYDIAVQVNDMFARFQMTNASALPHLTLVSGAPQSAAVNQRFAAPFQVAATDYHGQPYPSGYYVQFLAPAAGAGGTFFNSNGDSRGAVVLTDSRGMATSPPYTANGVEGSYTIDVSLSNAEGVTTISLPVINTPVAAERISSFFPSPLQACLGANFQQLRVQVTNTSYYPVSNLPITFVAPAWGAGGLFQGGVGRITVNTDSSGIAAASTFTANGVAGSYVVTASYGTLSLPLTLTNVNCAVP